VLCVPLKVVQASNASEGAPPRGRSLSLSSPSVLQQTGCQQRHLALAVFQLALIDQTVVLRRLTRLLLEQPYPLRLTKPPHLAMRSNLGLIEIRLVHLPYKADKTIKFAFTFWG